MKDTFYFTHDYNARTDEKIKRLIRKHGMEGYGVFWSIIEDLYNNANALQTDCEGIAFELRTDDQLVQSVIYEFDLFVFDGDTFGSLSVQKRLEQRNERSKKAAESAHKRWEKMQPQSERNANALRVQSDGNAIKEIKGKEKKESKEKKKGGFQPSFEELEQWMVEPLKIWWQYKTEKKSKYVQSGWDALIRKVREDFKTESDLMAAVNNSMAKNYQGLFAAKTAPQQTEPDYGLTAPLTANYDNNKF